MIVSFFFFFFSLLMLTSSVMVVISENLVYSILFLILSFFSAAGIIILLKLEFLGLIFLVLYVGAISILFLFVIMMVNNNKFSKIRYNKKFYNYLPFGCFLGFVFIIELIWTVLYTIDSNPYKANHLFNYHMNWYNTIDSLTDISTIGQILYTYYVLQFLLLGVILLMGLISSVVLTVRTKTKAREQYFFKQLSRNYKNVYKKKNSFHS